MEDAPNPPAQTNPPAEPTASSLSAAFPYDVHTPATTASNVALRRLTSLGSGLALLYIVHPLPHFTSLPPRLLPASPHLPAILHTLEIVLQTLLVIPTLFFTYALALRESPIVINNKIIPLKWLMPGCSGVLALAVGAEDTWIRTNLLWNMVVVLWACGWKVMSSEERQRMWKWTVLVGFGRVLEEVRREVWG